MPTFLPTKFLMQSLSKTPSIHQRLPSCKTTFSRHVAYLNVSMWCGTLCHLSFANLSNFLEIRAILNCLGIQRISTMYLDFARRTQRYVTRRHPRSKKILDFDRNYHFTIFQKFEFSGASQILNPFIHHYQTNILGPNSNYLDSQDHNLHSTQNLLLIHYIIMVF